MMTPEKAHRAEAIKMLIRLGWSPPPPNSEQAARIIDDIVSIGGDRRGHHKHPRNESLNLTPNEVAVLALLADGHTQDSVAVQLNYSRETIKTYTRRIVAKLGAKNTTHAVAIAYRAGQLELLRDAA